jgi:hypothetical protein
MVRRPRSDALEPRNVTSASRRATNSTARLAVHGQPRHRALSGRFLQVLGQSYVIDPQDRLVVFVSPAEETTTRLEVVTGLFDVLRRAAPAR